LNNLQGRKVVTAHGWVVQEPDQKRRNHFDMGDAMFLDQGANVLGPWAGAEHYASAMEKETLNPGTRERKVVRDGQNYEQDGILADPANAGSYFGVVRVIVVGARNQLRNAGGTAGKLKDGWVHGIDMDFRQC
jgi:hypothetical protein